MIKELNLPSMYELNQYVNDNPGTTIINITYQYEKVYELGTIPGSYTCFVNTPDTK